MPGKEIKGRSKIATYSHGGRIGKQFGGPLTRPGVAPARPLAQPGIMPTRPLGLKDGGRTELRHGGSHGKKGTFQKIKEGISRKLRGKELTDVRGIEQDIKTGALEHKAPKDRLDTQKGREFLSKVARWKIGYPHPERPNGKDMSYAARKKEIKKEKKEKKRKADWEKKYVK